MYVIWKRGVSFVLLYMLKCTYPLEEYIIMYNISFVVNEWLIMPHSSVNSTIFVNGRIRFIKTRVCNTVIL